ncbi:MAG: hydroxymethylbilane synthase [Deltaproteobacteria bacterium]|nr:hydroxymethylbilane synthase [Deltaproteobacteria bacterium]
MKKPNLLRIGTRKSPLAMWQAEYVRDQLLEAHPELDVELCPIVTKGDKILDVALSKVGGKGLFVKEIEQALLDGEVDLCVHSTKDVPADLPEGLSLVAFPPRADPRDALVMGGKGGLAALRKGARVGTSSLRRQAQILSLRPDVEIVSIRGNIQTRMKKTAELNLDCVVLAAAGLDRMAAEKEIGHRFSVDEMLPAATQGILSIEARDADVEVLKLLECLNDDDTRILALAERAFLRTLGGGCQVPIGAHCTLDGDVLLLRGMVAHPDGNIVVRGVKVGSKDDPEGLGCALGEEVLARGGRRVLVDIGLGADTAGGDGALKDATVIVARDNAPDDSLSQALLAQGARVLPLHLMHLDVPDDGAPLERAVRDLSMVAVLVFTSTASVERFFGRMKAAGTDLRSLPASALIAAVGVATRKALEEHHAAPDVVGEAGGEDLAVALKATLRLDGRHVLFPRAQGGRDELVQALELQGASVDVVDTHRSVPHPDVKAQVVKAFEDLAARDGDTRALLITSPKRVQTLAAVLEAGVPSGVRVLALGATTKAAAEDAGLGNIELCEAPTASAVVAALHKKNN